MGASLFLDNAIAKVLRGGGNGVDLPAPAALYAQLHTGAPGDAGTANVATESSRQEVWFTTSGRINTLANIPEWSNVAGTERYTHVSIWDSPTPGGGTYWGSGELAEPQTVGAGDAYRLLTFVCEFQ